MLHNNNTINNTVKTSNTSMTSETSAPFLMTAEAGETPNPPAGAGASERIPSFLLDLSKEDLARVIGYVEYLGTYGKVHSRVAYASEGAFVEEIKYCLNYGIPISVCVFTDEAGKPMVSTSFIGEQGCLPCGYRTKPHPMCIPAKAETATKKAKTLFWKIPVSWSMMATIEIEAATLAEAIEIARDKDNEIPLPDGTYMDESWEVDCDDEEYVRAWYNDNQKDLPSTEETAEVQSSIWSEVKNTYFQTEADFFEEDGDMLACITIDGYKSDDENEPGEVIAKVILSKHGDILVSYIDTLGRMDACVQKSISEAKAQLRDYFAKEIVHRED